jgi:hypothetical protein
MADESAPGAKSDAPSAVLDYDSLSRSPDELKAMVIDMAGRIGVCALLERSRDDLLAYLDDVAANMRRNPYHNFAHICDVTQFVCFVLVRCGLASAMRPAHAVGLFLAAVCHDLDHPGKSNNYQIAEQTELAVRYGNQSPLENHHLSITSKIMEKHGLLHHCGADVRDEVLSVVQNCILATDMAKHGSIMKRYSEIAAADSVGRFVEDPEIMIPVMTIILKCADISNQARPFAIATKWNQRVYQEFYMEGDADKTAGRGTNPLFDREVNNIPKSTVGFINFVVLPLFGALRKFLLLAQAEYPAMGTSAIDIAIESLTANCAAHKTIVEKQEAHRAAAASAAGGAAAP